MNFSVNLSLLRFWSTIEGRSALIISSKLINAVASQIESITVRTYSGMIRGKSRGWLNGFGYNNNLRCHPKDILKQNLFIKFLKQLMTKKDTKAGLEEEWGGPEAFKLIVFIKDNFDEVLRKNSSVLVFFSANWCQYCLRLRKPYGMAALMAKEANISVTFATFDVNYNPDLADEKGVVGIPLIKYYKDERFVSNYKGKRTAVDLFNFVKNPPEQSKDTKQPDI